MRKTALCSVKTTLGSVKTAPRHSADVLTLADTLHFHISRDPHANHRTSASSIVPGLVLVLVSVLSGSEVRDYAGDEIGTDACGMALVHAGTCYHDGQSLDLLPVRSHEHLS